jgi:hypothetical protein
MMSMSKVLVVSLSKSGARETHTGGWRKHYKITVKTFLVKIRKLMWAQLISVQEHVKRNLIQVCSYTINVFCGCI